MVAALHGMVVKTAVHGTVMTGLHSMVPSHGMVKDTALQAVVVYADPHCVEVEAATYVSTHRTALDLVVVVMAVVEVVEAVGTVVVADVHATVVTGEHQSAGH